MEPDAKGGKGKDIHDEKRGRTDIRDDAARVLRYDALLQDEARRSPDIYPSGVIVRDVHKGCRHEELHYTVTLKNANCLVRGIPGSWKGRDSGLRVSFLRRILISFSSSFDVLLPMRSILRNPSTDPGEIGYKGWYSI